MSNSGFEMFDEMVSNGNKAPQQAAAAPVQSTAPQFTMNGGYNIKKSYSDAEWDQVCQFYINKVNEVDLNADAFTVSGLQVLISKIDSLLGALRVECVHAKQKLSKYEAQLKTQKELAYTIVKKQNQGVKLTVDDVKSLVTKYIDDQNNWDGTGMNLFDLVQKSEERFIFCDNMLKHVCDKQDMISTCYGLLKTEAGINNVSENVPK